MTMVLTLLSLQGDWVPEQEYGWAAARHGMLKFGLLLVSWHGDALAVALVVCPTVGGSGATPRNSAHAPGLTSQWHWYGYAGNLYVPLGW